MKKKSSYDIESLLGERIKEHTSLPAQVADDISNEKENKRGKYENSWKLITWIPTSNRFGADIRHKHRFDYREDWK